MEPSKPEPTPPMVDRWDLSAVLGCAMLFAGLWLWVSLGCALSVVGALLLAVSVVGARNASAPADELAEHRDRKAAA